MLLVASRGYGGSFLNTIVAFNKKSRREFILVRLKLKNSKYHKTGIL